MEKIENVKNIGIFKNCIYNAIPLVFDESLSYYETLCALLGYLEKEIKPVINNNAEALQELQDKFVELKEYVDHYFDNLDVQEEINNKLDDMAESGELTEIIAQYLQLAGVLAYNTIAELKSAENIVNGSICKTLGKYTYNDGLGAFYKIRTVTSEDTVDDDTIIALQVSNTLIAEKIIKKKKIIIIGDSFSIDTQSGTPLWFTYIEKWNNVVAENYSQDAQGYATGENNFLNQLQDAYDNNEYNLSNISDVYILGGLNDLGNSSLDQNDFAEAVNNTLSYANSHFIYSKIHVIGILPFQYYNFYSGTSCFAEWERSHVFTAQLSYNSLNYDRVIFQNGEYFGLIQPEYFGLPNASNQRHPSAKGEKMIANFIQNGERAFGFKNGDTTYTYLKNTPITCTNGTISIDSLDNKHLAIKVENFDTTQNLDINLSGLPYTNSFVFATDEAGHTNAFYKPVNAGVLRLPALTGLNSGTVYITLDWDLM